MKKVLIIDSSKLFSEFMKEKLSTENITVEVSNGRRDAYTRLITVLPDLVIMDVSDSFTDLMDFLKSKISDPNAKNIYAEIKDKYPIVLTRDMKKAKEWLHAQVLGSERTGVLINKE